MTPEVASDAVASPAADAVADSPKPPRGDREERILRATFELLAEVGYQGLRFDAVAARAKASKATLYRHWSGKAHLVADAVRLCKAADSYAPDTGGLRGDLVGFLSVMAEQMAGEDGPLFAGLVMAMLSDPEFAREMRAMKDSKRQYFEEIRDRAVARGELREDCRIDLIDEIVPGQLFMRRFADGEPLDGPYVDHLVDDIILPLLHR
jgi:AcrR family transcriptional regulator